MDDNTSRPNRPKARQSIAHIPLAHAPELNNENVTADVSSIQRSRSFARQVEKKKSRSKSLGPGGLEALKEGTGNAAKPTANFPIKSILKPTVPLTPPKIIPTFDETRRRSTSKGKGKSPSRTGTEDLLIDFSTPAPTSGPRASTAIISGAENVVDPFSPMTRRSPRHSSEAGHQESEVEAARQCEEEKRRQSEKQAILEQRAARRKSMANRRVSFAPEATLHTWNVVELAEDSTTSSASNSTRRQSSMTAASSPRKNPRSPKLDSETSETPSTPPEQTEEPQVRVSPATESESHEKKRRRRSSGFSLRPPSLPNEDVSSSPFNDNSAVNAESSPIKVEESIHSDEDDTNADDDTAMSVDESTSETMASNDSGSSSQSSLDERLRKAAAQAGTRGIDYDENGHDLPMELVTSTVTSAFQPWVQKGTAKTMEDLSAMQDQENINPFSPAFKAQAVPEQISQAESEETQDMSMDVTAAVGGIIDRPSSPTRGRRKSVAPSRRRSSTRRRRSAGDDLADGDETMDLTIVRGGILQSHSEEAVPSNDNSIISNEDMSMEFTNVVGGVLGSQNAAHQESSSMMFDENETMDMTAVIGGILAPIEEQTEPQTDAEDQTMEMDTTVAVNKILPAHLDAATKTRAKELMEEETDVGQLGASPTNATAPPEPATTPSTMPSHVATSVASETGSPSFALKPRLSGRNNAGGVRKSSTPKTLAHQTTPVKTDSTGRQTTPTKQVTPLPQKAETPNKTPVSVNVTHRGASPKKLFKAEIKARASPASAQKSIPKSTKGPFDRDEHTGQQTPSVVLHAPKLHQHLRRRRRSSGLGIDQEGLGSPRIAEMLDRRVSIGESVLAFIPNAQQNKSLRFEDPRAMEQEIDAEHEEEERRESGRFVMEQEADQMRVVEDDNVTLQLKEMIESMTPKKTRPNKLKGRKSLHPGSARGILGKRPAELDLDDEEDEQEITPKRLKLLSREASPVKQVHLPLPPSKETTTGRLTRSKQQNLKDAANNTTITPTLSCSPLKPSAGRTPQPEGRFKDILVDAEYIRPTSFEDKMDNVLDAVDISVARAQEEPPGEEHEKISLQNFLNMTNIHFIELSTTKRRHTTVIGTPKRPSQEGQQACLEDCFAAAAATLPLLELYQHATKELKSYISSGRRIIRSIEAETLEEQPALFREYVDARPDVRLIMDNQFRNGKAHARLQSKEGWYAWRTQLVEGLRGGLESIREGMLEDTEKLTEQEQMLAAVLPDLERRYEAMQQEAELLRMRTEEMDNADQEALQFARSELIQNDRKIEERQALLSQQQQQMQDKMEALEAAAELKEEFESQITEAERVQEECRGWAPKDVLALKARVQAIEREIGWELESAQEGTGEPNDFGVALTMRYKDTLRLFFYPAAFPRQPPSRQRSTRRSGSDSGVSAPISLTYAPKAYNDVVASRGLSTERRFFLQLLQSQLHTFAAMPTGTISAKTLLAAVSNGWDAAEEVSEEIRLLNMKGITTVSIIGDEKVAASIMLILPGRGRVDIDFTIAVSHDLDGVLHFTHTVSARPKYGLVEELLKDAKRTNVQQALTKEVESKGMGTGSWAGAISGFEDWIASQQQQQQQQQQAETRKRLSPKKAPAVQKKGIPVPAQQKREKEVAAVPPWKEVVQATEAQKENIAPLEEAVASPDTRTKTPFTRAGALRRSPLGGR